MFTGVMPGMSGQEPARHPQSQRPELKVLYADDAVFPNGLPEPGTALLPKLYAREALLLKLREVLTGGT